MTRKGNTKVLALGVATLALVGTGGVALGAGKAAQRVSSKMDARQVVPHKPKGNVARAGGTLTGKLLSTSGSRWKLSWRLSYRNLDRPSIVIADIHYGKPGHFGPVIVRLCGPCKSGQRGVKTVKSAWGPAIQRGNAFITLITGKNPNGEIRGQVRVR